jgi:hypothetical protein
MQRIFLATTEIDATPSEVWMALTAWDQAHRWMKGVEWLRAEGVTAVGTEITVHVRGRDTTSRITECELGRCLTLRSTQRGVCAEYRYLLEALGRDRTRATLEARCEFDGVVVGLMAPLIRFAMRWADGDQLDALKRAVEGG